MQYPREKTPVHRVTVAHGDEQRDFSHPWIAVDQAAMTVHVWTHLEAPRPVLSVPLIAAVIEWGEPPAAHPEGDALPPPSLP